MTPTISCRFGGRRRRTDGANGRLRHSDTTHASAAMSSRSAGRRPVCVWLPDCRTKFATGSRDGSRQPCRFFSAVGSARRQSRMSTSSAARVTSTRTRGRDALRRRIQKGGAQRLGVHDHARGACIVGFPAGEVHRHRDAVGVGGCVSPIITIRSRKSFSRSCVSWVSSTPLERHVAKRPPEREA